MSQHDSYTNSHSCVCLFTFSISCFIEMSIRAINLRHFSVISNFIPVTTIWSCCILRATSIKYSTTIQNNNFMENAVENSDTCEKGKLTSVHSDQIHEVHNVPVDVLIRPIPSILDENKVQSLMETLQVQHVKKFTFYRFI